MNFDSLRDEFKTTLQQSFKKKNTDILKTKAKFLQKPDLDLKNPLDQAFRDLLLDLLEQEVSVNALKEYAYFCIETCKAGLCTATLPVVILGDMFEVLTLDACEELFTFVEDNVTIWKEDLFFSPCKNNLLRLCNDLLRRLSRSTATIFCGRILLFLAKFFPFSERSGLNIVSEFNLENTTEYGTDPGEDVKDSVIEIDSGSKRKTVTIDFTLYCKFWSLQDFFRYPSQCYDKVQWKLFCSHSNSILSTFQGLKLEYAKKEDSGDQGVYFSKYLTSQKLFDLQLYDNNFRRFVLLQFLILFQYLKSSVKFKSDSFELKSDQKEWISLTSEKIYKLLRETPPDGENFENVVINILAREEYWNAWKNDGCPEFKKPATSSALEKPKTKSEPLVGDLMKAAAAQGKYYLGSPELTKLWNLCPENLDSCKGKDRDFLPPLETYFADAIDQLENNPNVKDEQNLLKNSNFGWRALRLLAKRSPHFFTYNTTIMNQQSTYLEMMVRKIAHDRRGKLQQQEVPAAEIPNLTETEEIEENILRESEENENNEAMTQDMEAENEEFVDDNNPRQENKNLTETQISFIAEKIIPKWKTLGGKLGYKSDELEFFAQENSKELDQARNMLQNWFDEDEDATLDNFLYILEGLDMTDAVEAIKNEFSL